MLTFLEWPMLQNRRRTDRLSQLHKIIHHHTPAIELLSYFLPTQYPTRQMHQHHSIIPASSTLLYQKSFSPNTLRDWNDLPISIIGKVSKFTNNLLTINNIINYTIAIYIVLMLVSTWAAYQLCCLGPVPNHNKFNEVH